MSIVYALFAKSNPDEMRYIGRSGDKTPKGRLKSHFKETDQGDQTYKCNWIRKVLRSNDEVIAIILESNLTFEQSVEREIFLIAHYRSLGHRLTNATDGGEGMLGYKQPSEVKAKISATLTGRIFTEKHVANMSLARIGKRTGKVCTEEIREKLRLANTGHVVSEEARRKNRESNLGKKRSEETRRRIGEANKLKPRRTLSDEARKRISDAMRNKKAVA